MKKFCLLIIFVFLLACTQTGQEIISSGSIQKGLSKADMRNKFMSSKLSEDPFLPEGGRLYNSDTRTEILYPSSRSFYYVFVNVYTPVKCGSWMCKLGNGYYDSYHYTLSAAKKHIEDNYGKKKKTTVKKKKKELPKIIKPDSSDKIDKLQVLINDYESGKITREEFNNKKRALLKK